MRRISVFLVFLCLLFVPLAAQADTITLADYSTTGIFGGNAAGGGGPFLATTSGPVLGNTSFLTFCIEFNEHFNWHTPYQFALSDGAISGGVAGGNPDPVSDATKWLYYQVRAGNAVSVYEAATGTSGAAGLTSIGAGIQNAIWLLESERLPGELGGAATVAVDLQTYALNHAGEWAGLLAQGHRVYAMNLTTANGSPIQDQLALTTVPEPGSLLLLGTGLIGLARTARRRSRK